MRITKALLEKDNKVLREENSNLRQQNWDLRARVEFLEKHVGHDTIVFEAHERAITSLCHTITDLRSLLPRR